MHRGVNGLCSRYIQCHSLDQHGAIRPGNTTWQQQPGIAHSSTFPPQMGTQQHLQSLSTLHCAQRFSQSACSISTLDLPCSTRIAPHTACVTACPCISVNMLPRCELCCCVLQALKINVDMLKLIQLGLTFTNAGASQLKHSSWSLFLSAHQCLAQQLAQ